MHWRKYQYFVVDLTISKSRPVQLVTLTPTVTTAPTTPSYGRAACERFPSSEKTNYRFLFHLAENKGTRTVYRQLRIFGGHTTSIE
jgi:hypothetical protein